MITKDHLALIINMPVPMVNQLAFDCGYEANFRSAIFIGINGDGHFVYEVSWEEEEGRHGIGKVFIKYNHKTNTLSLDF